MGNKGQVKHLNKLRMIKDVERILSADDQLLVNGGNESGLVRKVIFFCIGFLSTFVVYRVVAFLVVLFLGLGTGTWTGSYPLYAQTAYESPRESTGKIVCSNCHLAEKP